MQPYLDKIAERLLKKFPDGMENILVVLPSKRSVIFLKNYLSRRISKPVFLPKFKSIDEFLEDISELKVLDNSSLQFRLYDSYLNTKKNKKESFDKFLNWSSVALHDFNDIDKSLVNPSDIYSNLKNAKELENWSVENWSFSEKVLTSQQDNFVSFFSNMLDLYLDFTKNLLSNNLAYQGLAYRQAFNKIKVKNLKWQKIWFVGLNALTKAEQEILNYLKEKDIARVFWDADEFYYNNPLNEAGSFLRAQRDKWREIDFEGVGSYFSRGKKKFQIIGCPKKISQAKTVGQLIQEIANKDLNNSNSAIVLADESLLFPVLHSIPPSVDKLNITMGSPVKNTAFYAFLEILFNMYINRAKYKKESFYYKDLIDLIEHPYFIRICGLDKLECLKESIISKNIIFINSNFLAKFFNDNNIKLNIRLLFSDWDHSSKIISSLEDIVFYLREKLVGKKATIESEVLTVINKNIIILKRLIDEAKFKVDLITFHKIFKQLISKEVIPFEGEPLQGLQLMGLLESRTLDFKNIIILGVNEGVLPRSKTINSFIPYDLRVYFNLPTYRDRDALYAYHFYRLLQRAENITLVYDTEVDNFGSGEKSRFITQLLSEYKYSQISHLTFENYNLNFSQQETVKIKNEGLEEQINDWAKKGVSASAISKYNKCQISFYYYYLAKIRELNEVDEYADASTIGTALHNTLEKNYPIGELKYNYIIQNKDKIIKDVDKQFSELLLVDSVKEGKNYLNLKIAKKLISDFLNLELKLLEKIRKKGNRLVILEKEKDLKYSLKVENYNFNLVGKVDRIDLDGDNLRIIDYKTGKVTKKDLIINDLEDLTDVKKSNVFQLLMYAYLYSFNLSKKYKDEIYAANISFKNIKDEVIMISKKDNHPLIINQEILNDFERQLKALLLRITKEDFVATKDPNLCKWCEYKSICKS